jgi:hypothetical protein
MQHCAFVVTPERLRDIQERLIRHKVPFLGPIPNMPGSIGIYFFDPNNIRLEIDCQTHDGSSPEVIGTLLQTKRQAHAELATLPDVNAEWLKKYTLAMPD